MALDGYDSPEREGMLLGQRKTMGAEGNVQWYKKLQLPCEWTNFPISLFNSFSLSKNVLFDEMFAGFCRVS